MTSPANAAVDLDVDVVTAHRLFTDGAARIVDVREPDEWHAGHVDGALLIPMAQLGGRLKELNHGDTWLAICRTGHRSDRAANFLRASGIDIRNVAGGMRAWEAAGLSVVNDNGEPGEVI